MRVLAIDPGFERVGIAVLEKKDGRESLLYSDCFRTSAADTFHVRLSQIGEAVESLVASYGPERLAIESLVFNTNQKTAMRVAEVRGAILYIASRHNIQPFEYTPLQVKVAVTGYGRAPKEQVTAIVGKLIDIDDKKRLDDEYDAIAIGLAHLASTSAP